MLFCNVLANAQAPSMLSDLRKFYKVNKTYKFIVPATSKKSQKISVYWDSTMVAHYSTKLIKRDSVNEQSHIAFVPPQYVDTVKATLLPPAKGIEEIVLILNHDGTLTPQYYSSCPCYCWVCGSSPAFYNYTYHYWYCNYPQTPAHVLCGGSGGSTSDEITFYSAYYAPNSMVAQNNTAASSSTQLYPNPSNNIVHIHTKGSTIFTLTNYSGEIMLVKKIDGDGIIDVSKYVAGIYYLKNKTTGEVQKVMVEK